MYIALHTIILHVYINLVKPVKARENVNPHTYDNVKLT